MATSTTERRKDQANRTTNKASDLKRNAPPTIGENDGGCDPHEEAHIDQGCALGSDHVVLDQIAHGGCLVHLPERHGDDHGREDADSIGGEILEEPGNGREDGGANVLTAEQLYPIATALLWGDLLKTIHAGEGEVLTVQQLAQLFFRFLWQPATHQPVAAFRQEEPPPHHRCHGNNRHQEKESPVVNTGHRTEDDRRDRRAQHRADRLKAERTQHQSPADGGRDAL